MPMTPNSNPGRLRLTLITGALLALAAAQIAAGAESAPLTHRILPIHLPATAAAPVSGRLLLFVTAAPTSGLADAVDADEFDPQSVTIAAQDIPSLAPGATAQIDTDLQAYPAGLSTLKPGDYFAQAVLDVNHDYAYGGRTPGDLVSALPA